MSCTELTIDELLADPMVGALMAADGVERAAFGRALRDVQGRFPPAYAARERDGAALRPQDGPRFGPAARSPILHWG